MTTRFRATTAVAPRRSRHRPAVTAGGSSGPPDLHLPDIGGEQVLQHLRANPNTESTPIVVLSADATAGQIERILAQGATGYITKPLDVKELLDLVDRTLDPAAAPAGG